MKRIHTLLMPVLFAQLLGFAHAEVPDLVNYQGYVTDSAGVAIANGTTANHEMIFRIYGTGGGNIFDGTIAAADLANNAVEKDKIKADAVDGSKIKDLSVGTTDLADNSVTSAKISDGTIVSADLGNGAVDIAKLAAAVQQALCPVGTILPYAGDTAPAGWKMCDGSSYYNTSYPELYAKIGYRFGSGIQNGNPWFRVPDLRGRFLRGKDDGQARDPDRSTRSAMASGGATGNNVGSIQGDQYRSHAHPYDDVFYAESGGTVSLALHGHIGSGDTDHDNWGYTIPRTTGSQGGSETRPVNAYVNFIIKL